MKQIVKDTAEQILISFTQKPYIGCLTVASLLYKVYGMPKKANNNKQIYCRLDLLQRIVSENEVERDFSIPAVMEFAVKYCESQNEEVRIAANDLIFECFKLVGFDRVEPMLSGK